MRPRVKDAEARRQRAAKEASGDLLAKARATHDLPLPVLGLAQVA